MNPPPSPDPGPAAPRGDAPDESVFGEVRRSAAESRGARGLALRVVGLAVVALAVLVIARNVSWADSLRIEVEGGAAIELEGSIEGGWRDDAVTFAPLADERLDEDESEAARSAGALAALEAALSDRSPLRATADAVTLPSGAALATSGGAPDALTATRIAWRPGMSRTLREVELLRLLPALGFLVLASLTVATRWWRLLRLNHCPTRWYDAFRYTYTGLFFNAVVPGFNGGDVARVVAVVRDHPDRRADALMTVVVDRAIGLVAMVLLGTAVILASDDRLQEVKLPVALFSALLLAGLAAYFHPGVRRLVRFERIVQRLPQADRILRLDRAARRLLRHPFEVALAVALSFANHLLGGLAVFSVAAALGTTLGLGDWLATMAIANTLSAVPISPGGLGVGEVLFGSLAATLGSTYAIGVTTSLLYRLALYAMSLLGGLVMLLPAGRAVELPADDAAAAG